MLRSLTAVTLLAIIAPLAAAADPVITFQTQPLGRQLNDIRQMARTVAGEDGVKSINEGIKSKLGAKGFDGFDISRPIVGYIDVPANLEEFVAVVAFPVTGEKEWLEFCERWNKSKPKELKDGVYEVPGPGPEFKAAMKVVDGYAYIATGIKDPGRVLDAKNIVPFVKLYDGTDISLAMGKLYVDRIPKELRAQAKGLVDQLKKARLPGMSEMESQILLKPVHQLTTKLLDLSEGAKEAVLRVNGDAISGAMAAELTVVPAGGSALEKAVAGIKPGTNKFASLVTPDTAGTIRLNLGTFLAMPEVQASAVAGLEAMQKEAQNNAFPPMKAIIDELLKGLMRTAKSGEAEGLAVLRGPAKDGTFTGIAAITFDDPSGFEKELKAVIDANAPPDFKESLKWDAEKAGGVSIHTIDLSKMPGGDREFKAIFGNNVMMAFAFSPKVSYLALGPGGEAVAGIKAAMNAKPGPAPTADFSLNADRIVKLILSMEPRDGQMVAKIFGNQDKLATALGFDVTGGKDLKMKFTMNVRLFGSLFGFRAISVPADIPAEKLEK